ncbi:MAG TPA: di-heme oxidoredictase family protein [Burkholderiales bacterium]|nr:di-heme oxidoredictase family protein [Burkholderiales bacterium]
MSSRIVLVSTLLLPALVAGTLCFAGNALEDPDLSAGTFTIRRFDAQAFSEPAPVLTVKQRQVFMAGRSVFNRQWATVNSLNGDWGLGPTFVADRCSACHVGSGRGSPPKSGDEQLLSMLVRLSVPGTDGHGGPKPHPHYGDQLQNRGLDGKTVDVLYAGTPVPNEADLFLDWEEIPVALSDGGQVALRKPRLRIERLNFGELGPDVMLSLRNAQPLVGIGFLEAVPEEALLDIARKQRALGYDGRPNRVWDAVRRRVALGRFGWKANVPSLKQQVAAAAIGDMGVNSNLYAGQNCPPVQVACAKQLPGNFPELIDAEIDSLELWLQALAVPARRHLDDPEVRRGAGLFAAAQCAVCHVPELKTAKFEGLPQLSDQVFHAYTDLLLHDMGEGLADGRPDFGAGPRDWRTPALWGLGLSKTVSGSTALLHDGRARNVVEAILWHGGEGERSREAFGQMSKPDRDALVKFVESI